MILWLREKRVDRKKQKLLKLMRKTSDILGETHVQKVMQEYLKEKLKSKIRADKADTARLIRG